MWITLALLFLVQVSTISGDKITLPVMMLDFENAVKEAVANPNPFFKLSTVNFAEIIHDSVRNSQCVIIFIEEYMSTEDVSARDKMGTPYPHLQTALTQNKVKYFPAVTQPFRVLTHILQPQKQNIFHLSDRWKPQLTNNNLKYMYVFFEDGINGTRIDFLRNHDRMMSDVYFAVRKLYSGPIVAFYTGKTNPVDIEFPEFVSVKPPDVPREKSMTIASDGALFRFIGVFATTASRRANLNQMPSITKETRSDSHLSTKMAYMDFDLEFNFSFDSDGWLIDSVALLEGDEEVGRTKMAVGAPWGWSYECGEPLAIVNTRDNSIVTISQYQIQPRARRSKLTEDGDDGGDGGGDDGGGGDGGGGDEGDGDGGSGHGANAGNSTCFSSSVNCGPYFNTNILSGMLVATICLAIAGWGVVMLAGCNANNRYDDPYGKPILPPEH